MDLKNKLKYIRKVALSELLLKNVQRNKRRIRKKVSEGEKLVVVFILQYPEMWNSVKSIYLAALNDEKFEAKIICMPKKKGTNGNERLFHEINEAEIFCKDNALDYINAYSNGEWMPLKQWNADYIFVQRPYDEFVPKCYELSKLSKSGLLCYVPYGYEYMKGIHLDIEYNYRTLANVYMLFTENEDTYNYVSEKSVKELRNGSRKIFDVGYPRFDLINMQPSNGKLTRFLWLPRWSINEINDRSHFFDYFDLLFDYLSDNQELSLVIRPHPLMFDNFISNGLMTIEQVEQLKQKINNTENIKFDKNLDYTITFGQSDILIADLTTLVIEYFLTGKPIIFCGENIDDFNSVGKQMLEGLYISNDADSLFEHMNNLVKNGNQKEDAIKKSIQYIVKAPNVGEKIKDILYEDLQLS